MLVLIITMETLAKHGGLSQVVLSVIKSSQQFQLA